MTALVAMLGTLMLVASTALCAQAADTVFPVTRYGAKADGLTDATAALQKAVNAAAKRGGIVTLPAGKFLIAGSVKVPAGVTVRGVNARPLYIEPPVGTIILATGGRDDENGS